MLSRVFKRRRENKVSSGFYFEVFFKMHQIFMIFCRRSLWEAHNRKTMAKFSRIVFLQQKLPMFRSKIVYVGAILGSHVQAFFFGLTHWPFCGGMSSLRNPYMIQDTKLVLNYLASCLKSFFGAFGSFV